MNKAIIKLYQTLVECYAHHEQKYRDEQITKLDLAYQHVQRCIYIKENENAALSDLVAYYNSLSYEFCNLLDLYLDSYREKQELSYDLTNAEVFTSLSTNDYFEMLNTIKSVFDDSFSSELDD